MSTLLYIITEGIQGGPFELTEGTHVIGSAEGASVLIPDMTISAQHGQIDINQGQIVYSDLGSQNGSFVGEQQVLQPVALSPGHILQLGVNPGIHLQFVDDPNVVETMKRETAVIAATPKGITPDDFGAGGDSDSAFQTKKSGWVKIYIITISIIGVVAVGALIYILLM
jgi:pSer/pThr/pTyr-binding forkhead associated (FHA) protein